MAREKCHLSENEVDHREWTDGIWEEPCGLHCPEEGKAEKREEGMVVGGMGQRPGA